MQQDITTYILIALGVLLILNVGIIVYLFLTNKRISIFFKKGDKDLESFLKTQIQAIENNRRSFVSCQDQIDYLKGIAQISFQKVGLVRFNPFQSMGSDQSFCLALLNQDNDGFIITSHFGRDFNRIYLKSVAKGRSDYSLAKEEQEAVQKAMEFVKEKDDNQKQGILNIKVGQDNNKENNPNARSGK